MDLHVHRSIAPEPQVRWSSIANGTPQCVHHIAGAIQLGYSRCGRSERYVSIANSIEKGVFLNSPKNSVIRVFELVPGASRQTDATVFKHTNAVDRVASSRAGHTDNQIVAFVDVNRELFCTNSLVNGTNVEVHKIG